MTPSRLFVAWAAWRAGGGVRPEIKFCGLTLPADAARASALGARYAGVIFAGGPRQLTPERAVEVLDAAGPSVLRVGVVAGSAVAGLEALVRTAGLNVIQLHNDPLVDDVARVRARTRCEVWAVIRLAGARFPDGAGALFAAADAVVLDARVDGVLGGTGVALPWDALADGIATVRGGARLVLAGGLTPTNVQSAIAALQPDVVDVSSGVETSPGVKDPALMRAFAEAVMA